MTSDNDAWNAPMPEQALATAPIPADDWGCAPEAASDPLPLPSGDPLDDLMPEPTEEGDADGAIRLEPTMRAEALLEALKAMPARAPLRLNASAVTRLSLPMIQVILSACRTAEAAGERLGVVDPSFAFSLAFEAFGFGPDNEPYTVEYA